MPCSRSSATRAVVLSFLKKANASVTGAPSSAASRVLAATMSELGQSRHIHDVRAMSACPPDSDQIAASQRSGSGAYPDDAKLLWAAAPPAWRSSRPIAAKGRTAEVLDDINAPRLKRAFRDFSHSPPTASRGKLRLSKRGYDYENRSRSHRPYPRNHRWHRG